MANVIWINLSERSDWARKSVNQYIFFQKLYNMYLSIKLRILLNNNLYYFENELFTRNYNIPPWNLIMSVRCIVHELLEKLRINVEHIKYTTDFQYFV